ncbi:MAG: hypothetical protein IPO58_15590, partial [Betaproteobacteria bacterium]|nr:hypothetical protein [Betaproteobacteria bacterium]
MSDFATTCARWAAISSLLFTPLAAALPSSSPGSVDPNYGTNGVLAFSIRNGLEFNYAIVPGRDGKWLVSGSAQDADGQGGARYLLRLDSNGGIDTGFGAQGLLYPGGDARVLAVQTSGRIVIAGTHVDGGGVENATLRRLLADGAPDPDFGTTGGATILQSATVDWPHQSFAAIELDAQGRIVGGTNLRANVAGAQRGEVWRFAADGAPDATFGSLGRVALDDVAPYLQLQQLQAQPDGKVVIAAWCQADSNAKSRACVIRLNNDGSRDTAFGPNGVRDIAPPAGTSYYLYELRIAGDGKIYAAGANFSMRPATAFIIRLNADGTMDGGYGTGGIAALTFPGNYAYVYALHPLADGRQIVVGYNDSPGGQTVGYVARLTPAGLPDPSFGTGGFGAAASAAPHILYDGVVLADGSILAVGWRYNVPGTTTDIDTLLVRYVGVETLGGVIGFHNTTLDHYFITPTRNEAAAIDGGSAGPGWSAHRQYLQVGRAESRV